MRTLSGFSILWFFLVALLAGQSSVTPTFKSILVSSGLGHLNDDEMGKVESLLDGMTKASITISKEKTEGYDSVVDFLRSQGYEPELVVIGRESGKDVLIVGKTLRECTLDIPSDLSLTRFRN